MRQTSSRARDGAARRAGAFETLPCAVSAARIRARSPRARRRPRRRIEIPRTRSSASATSARVGQKISEGAVLRPRHRGNAAGMSRGRRIRQRPGLAPRTRGGQLAQNCRFSTNCPHRARGDGALKRSGRCSAGKAADADGVAHRLRGRPFDEGLLSCGKTSTHRLSKALKYTDPMLRLWCACTARRAPETRHRPRAPSLSQAASHTPNRARMDGGTAARTRGRTAGIIESTSCQLSRSARANRGAEASAEWRLVSRGRRHFRRHDQSFSANGDPSWNHSAFRAMPSRSSIGRALRVVYPYRHGTACRIESSTWCWYAEPAKQC